MDLRTIAFWIVFVLIVIFLWRYATTPRDMSKVLVVPGSQAGSVDRSVPVALPISFNEPEGLVYSYSAWILVNDFGEGYGQRRRIFNRDDSPGLFIDSTSNSFIVSVKTFGSTETILIPSIPAMKWIHFAMTVDQRAVDIYINGTLRQHHSLSQLPKQTDAAIAMGPGWDGVLAKLTYYARGLSHTEIKRMAAEPVPDDLQRAPAAPQYFDLSWYIGRFYSA